MASSIKTVFLLFGLFVIVFSCTKNTDPNTGGGVTPPPPPAATKLSYGDSIFYLHQIISSHQTKLLLGGIPVFRMGLK
jgi:hypothetical protein